MDALVNTEHIVCHHICEVRLVLLYKLVIERPFDDFGIINKKEGLEDCTMEECLYIEQE